MAVAVNFQFMFLLPFVSSRFLLMKKNSVTMPTDISRNTVEIAFISGVMARLSCPSM